MGRPRGGNAGLKSRQVPVPVTAPCSHARLCRLVLLLGHFRFWYLSDMSGRADDVRSCGQSRPRNYDRLLPKMTDIAVEKVFWGWRTKFPRAAYALRAQRCERPRRFSEKRPRTFVLALCSIPAADLSKNQHLRDFWSFSIFDFFNSIDPLRKSARPRNIIDPLDLQRFSDVEFGRLHCHRSVSHIAVACRFQRLLPNRINA